MAAARQEQAYRASKGQNQYTTSEKMEPGKLNKYQSSIKNTNAKSQASYPRKRQLTSRLKYRIDIYCKFKNFVLRISGHVHVLFSGA